MFEVYVKDIGKNVILKDEPFLTNRLFPGWFGDVGEGEEYIVEYKATAEDDEGNTYLLFWQFDEVKGDETPEEFYDWDDVMEVVPLY